MFWPHQNPHREMSVLGVPPLPPGGGGRRRDGFKLLGCSGKALFHLSCCVVFFNNRNRLMIQGAGTMNAHLAFRWGQ